MPGLGTSFGRGGATTAQSDLANADAILIMGSSMAENHPVGFQWVMEAREKGAKIIHVDPRFTRTSAMADIWVPLRAGSDILFLGALIHYVLENNKDFREYVVPTPMPPPSCGKIFETRKTWTEYSPDGMRKRRNTIRKPGSTRERPLKAPTINRATTIQGGGHGKDRGGEAAGRRTKFESDPTLQHPRCVFQVLKRHFARYTPEMVERFCGSPAGCLP